MLIWSNNVYKHFLVILTGSLPKNSNSDFYSIFHLQLSLLTYLKCNKCFHEYVWHISWILSNIYKTLICRVLSIILVSLPTYHEIQQVLPEKCATYRIKYFPSILMQQIQIHQSSYAMFCVRLTNNWIIVISIVFCIVPLLLLTCLNF